MPTSDQIDRFRSDLAALAGSAAERIGIAVSGGPDSLALLLLAHAALPGRVEAATVDHRLRPENAAEAAAVAALCATLGVPHATLADEADALSGASVQAKARALRYRLLGAWAGERRLTLLATAHHLDDQAETILMRLARGAGPAGLAGIRARRSEGAVTLVRPLLSWRREELAAIAAEADIAAADDPSNRSDAYDRTRFRALLAGTPLLPPERLAAAAANLAQTEDALAWATERAWGERMAKDDDALILDPADLPPELLRRLAVRAISSLAGGASWREDKLPHVLAEAAAGRVATLGGVRIAGGPRWRFAPAPPRRNI